MHLITEYGGWRNRRMLDFYEKLVAHSLPAIRVWSNIGLPSTKST